MLIFNNINLCKFGNDAKNSWCLFDIYFLTYERC